MRSLDAPLPPAGRDVSGVSAPDQMRRLLDRAVAASSNGIVITDPNGATIALAAAGSWG